MPPFLIERTFADLVPTDAESMAAIKLVNDEIGAQWLFSFLSADEGDSIFEVGEIGPDAAVIASLRPHPDGSAIRQAS
jgi:hypothetical protein